jgi:hypothetical protein
MKNLRTTAALFALLSLTGCWTKLGDLTTVSNRNIDSGTNYVELARYVEGRGKQLKHKKQGALEMAIDNTVKSIPGGEFLKNATIRMTPRGRYIRIVGDVWGIPGVLTEAQQKAAKFNIGDNVSWNNAGNFMKGTITGKDEDKAMVKYIDGKGVEQLNRIDYDRLTIIDENVIVPVKTSTNGNTTNTSGFTVGQQVEFDDPLNGWTAGEITYIASDNKITVRYNDKNGLAKTKEVAPVKVRAKN